ncbi:MAG: DUF2807 domain-containing protein [Flammeovirgaceae bacterium]|nr:MAG: DUF2807 domain-containing protein [Flammeovirgaceae bacterium]
MAKNLILALLFSLPVSAMAQRQSVNLETFNAIDVFGPFDVELIYSDKNRVELEYKGVDSKDVVAGVSGNTLKLKLRNRHYFNDWGSDSKWDEYIRVKVYYTDIDEIKASAGAVVTTSDRLKSKNLAIDCSMGAEISMEVLAKNLYLKSNMGSVLRLNGRTEYLEVKSSMGGVIKARQLQSKSAYVKASMGSEVFVSVTDEIEVSAGLGAVVDYAGSPAVRHTNTNFGAEVRGRDN